jgi:hypothetical protein
MRFSRHPVRPSPRERAFYAIDKVGQGVEILVTPDDETHIWPGLAPCVTSFAHAAFARGARQAEVDHQSEDGTVSKICSAAPNAAEKLLHP